MRSIRAVLRKFGVKYTKKEYAKRFAGTGSRYIISTLLRDYNIRADVGALVRARAALYQRLIEHRRLKTFPGFGAFLRALKRNKIPIALASGGHRINVVSSLKAAGLKPSDFPVKITVENVPQRKPHPQIFLAAAQALRANPRDCVVIEDSIVGVKAAKRARMRCVALLTTSAKSDLKQAGADLIVKDFRDRRLWRFVGLRAGCGRTAALC